MTFLELVGRELDGITAGNKRVLERLPGDQLLWKPHARSMTLGRLGQHLAELPHWIARISQLDHFDFVRSGIPFPEPPSSVEEILELWRAKREQAMQALAEAGNIDLDQVWEMRRDGTVISSTPRREAYTVQLQHMVHHRGQLTVYLRLLDVPVPGLYGPSADERH